MESRSIKIKDYVTHERVPVRGDSHGNFTLSPLGFPFVNRSGYEPGLPPPTKFTAEMLVKPDLAVVKNGDIIVIDEKLAKIYMEYKDKFDFPRTDSDHDTFKVDAKLTSDGTGYQISSEHATFYAGCPVTIEVEDATYEAINGDYTVFSENYIKPQTVVSVTGIKCTVTFHPEQVETSAANPLFVRFTNNGNNSGIYKLIVSRTLGSEILYYTWIYKTSVQDSCESQELPVEFDETMNDNVHDHYRNRVSDEEVADYLRDRLGAAIDCGKFRGAEYPVDAHGLLVKWFLSHGAIVHSIAGRTVVLDGFGHVIDTSGLGDCSGTPTDEHLLSNIGQLHNWLMSTAGTNDYADYPSVPPLALASDNNNIRLEDITSGDRHTFVIGQALANMVSAPPRKTFIHLPTALNLADGTELELNVALPVVSQPNPVDDEDVKDALKSFTDYVSQPRVYILSGKQTPLPNNAVPNRGITTSANSFTLLPKHPIDTDASTIAFGLYNRYECPKTFHFVGSLANTILNDGLVVENDDYTVLFNNRESMPAQVGDSILLEYDVTTPIIGKVTDISENNLVVDFGRELRKPYDGNSYVVEYNGDNCNAERATGDKPQYVIDSITGVEVGDLLEFTVVEVYKEEKRIVSTKSSSDGIMVTFSTPILVNADDAIHGIVSEITVTGKDFPYNRSTRRWTMYSKDATCMVDVRTVDAQDGLTEHTEDSGAFTNDTSSEPELIDNDSIIATIYPTSTNTFPWRLNGRNRIRHLGLTTNANVDYVSGGGKPLTRLVFEMNERVYDALSGIYRGFRPKSELRYCEDNNNTSVGNSVLGSLLRVTLPSSLDADVDEEDKDNMYVVRRARKAFYDLIGDFKVARVGYVSNRDYDDKKNTKWGDGSDVNTPTPDIDPDDDDNLQRLNDWETKIIHLPNNCLGVDENLYRNLAYAGWNEYTHTDNFRIFYAQDVDDFVDRNGYGGGQDPVGNRRYLGFKDDAGTTQRTVDPYLDIAEDDAPFNYTVENSVFKIFLPNPTTKTRNQYAAFVHGFLELPVIKRGLRSISWLTTAESEFDNRDMEPFYPSSHVMSTDGVAFPDVSREALIEVAQSTDTDVKRALLAIPDKVAIYNNDYTKELGAELISVNLRAEAQNKEVVDYMKSLLTMYSNGMPLHLYDAHRAINVESSGENDLYRELLHAHEVTLYNDNASDYFMERQHKYCDLATAEGQDPEDVNMTYNFISDDDIDPEAAPISPLSLTTPLENVSSTFISNEFTGMYTRVHVKVMFSSALGRWIVKDYRQYPTCFLTPLYGAKTIDYMEKSYAFGNPKSYANRVQMSEGVVNKKFSASKYVEACEEQPLWQLPCGAGSDYTDSLYKRYVEQPAMEMNPGCVPFLLESFPYDDEGKLNGTIKFRNLYESISTPMDANGDPKEGSVPEVNFWNIKLHIRPARSAYPGADIPSDSARTGGTLGDPTLGMFHDLPEEEEEQEQEQEQEPTEDNSSEVDENNFSE